MMSRNATVHFSLTLSRYFPDWHMRYLHADNDEDRLYGLLGRTFEAMRLPLRPEVSQMLDKLIGEPAEQALRRAS